MIASVAPPIAPLIRLDGLTSRVRQPQELAAELAGNPNRAPKLAASQVALAPAAMSALIEAQAHMSRDATPTDRSDTAQKIDHILSRLTDTPPAQPVGQATDGDFSLQMLVNARQLLRGVYA